MFLFVARQNVHIGPLELLNATLNGVSNFAVMFDESYNYVEKESQSDFPVRYRDNVSNCVVNKYYILDFLGKATALDF